MSTLEKAIQIAAKAHEGQTDKVGEHYILHPLRVMLKFDTDAERIVAVLHDVVEDSEITFYDLKQAGFSDEILAAIDALTKRPGESKIDAAKRASENKLACYVKLRDNLDNLDINRISALREDQVIKYLEVRDILTHAIQTRWAFK
jgi:(p)ppGpp synthase/HD superfamily hydrolase